MKNKFQITSMLKKYMEQYDVLESKLIKQWNEDDAAELLKLDHYIKILRWTIGDNPLL